MSCPHGSHLLPGECFKCTELRKTPPETPVAKAQAAIKRLPLHAARFAVEADDLNVKATELQLRIEDMLGDCEACEHLNQARMALDRACAALRVVKP